MLRTCAHQLEKQLPSAKRALQSSCLNLSSTRKGISNLTCIMHRLTSNLNLLKQTIKSNKFTQARFVAVEKREVPYKTLKDVNSDNVASVPSRADAVVVGGGTVGCSTIYHLSKLGLPNSVLVEKDQLTAGTSWHTAGMLWRLRADETDLWLSNITRDVMFTIEEETGVNSGFTMNGGLFLGGTKQRIEEFKRLKAFGECMGIESHILTPDEAQKLYPIMNKDDLVGALYSPTDGHIDPAGYCTALSRAAKLNGAQTITNCEVIEIETGVDSTGRKRVKAVNTSKGRIETDNVVICGGCWTPHILKSFEMNIPQLSFEHSYVVTEAIEGVRGMPNVRDHEHSFYLKVQGDVLQVGGFETRPVFLENGVPKDFSFGLFDLNWEAISDIVESACKRVPDISKVGIRSTVSGPESFSADGKPIIGPDPYISGLFHGHTMNSGGAMLSGGCGKMIAQWVIRGEPELDMVTYDARRFNEKLLGNKKWLRETAHESFVKKYSMLYRHDESLAGRPGVRDALYETLLKDGCVYQSKGGWERPGWFDVGNVTFPLPYDYEGEYGHVKNNPHPYAEKLTMDYTFDHPAHHNIIGEECLNARNNVNMFNMSYFGKLYLCGPDATKAAEWIFSNNMDKPPGSTTYTCMLNKLGGIESDLTVSVVEDDGPQALCGVEGRSYYAATGGRYAPYFKSRITDIIAQEKFDCQVNDLSHDMILLSIQGPKSRDLLSKVCPQTDFSNESFPFSTHQLVTIGGHVVRAMRVSFIGELGWELHASNSAALDVYNTVIEVGKAFGLRNSGYRALDSLSIEKGYHLWHSDIRSDDSPLEADMTFTCKLKTDIPFVGRQAVEEYKASGIQKRLVCFTLDQNLALHGLETIYRNGEAVGYIRRAEFAFALDKEIAVGYVKNPAGGPVDKEFIMSGNYQLDRMGQLLDATAHLKSPFDPQDKRLMGFYS